MQHLKPGPKYLPGKTAPGAPGATPTWAAADKDFVTTALGSASPLWATGAHGILTEAYYPSTGRPQLRHMGFYVVRDGAWVDLVKARTYTVSPLKAHVPLPTVVHEGELAGSTYRLTLTYLPDPRRATLLVRYALTGGGRLVIVAAPHLGDSGTDNTAKVEDGLLYGSAREDALCIAASGAESGGGFDFASAGFAGWTDGALDLAEDGALDWRFDEASDGNVTLTGQLAEPEGLIAIGFAPSTVMARGRALASLEDGFATARAAFVRDWEAWGGDLDLPAPTQEIGAAATLSATVIKVHEDRSFPGAIAASLSTPWGDARNSSGGYHLVWPRDAGLTAFALIASGQIEDARSVLAHLIATQQPAGRWAQTAFPDGRPFLKAEQLDEVAMPILLAAKLREMGAEEVLRTGAMVRSAAAFIARRGPVTDQERWEETSGLSPFTIALEIAALVAAVPWLRDDERAAALDIADERNERVEEWCSVAGTEMGTRLGVARYYVRISPKADQGGLAGRVPLGNRGDAFYIPATEMLGLDFSYLVRLGLRAPTDPVVIASLKAVDRTLGVDFEAGPLYRRYQGDGYGEHADGGPYDSQGLGRAWPLLGGERGHLAVCAGEDARPWMEAMLGARGPGGLLPEQVWDTDDLPERHLFRGKPTGSAMPLVWAHAEFLKLVIAAARGEPVERIEAVTARYAGGRPAAKAWRWREEVPMDHVAAGRDLLLEANGPFTLRVSLDGDGWQDRISEVEPFGVHGVRLHARDLAGHATLAFRRCLAGVWERYDWKLAIGSDERPI